MGSIQVSPARVRFGVFEADLPAGELRRNGVKVRLQDLPFRALALLLSRPGEVITREEFRQALWPPDVFVDFEQGISSCVMRLRDALRDSAENPVFIETIERRGYRWIGPIQPAETAAKASREKEAVSEPTVAAQPPVSSSWRKLIFTFPILALLFAVWIFRPGYHNAKAGAKSDLSSTPRVHSPANHEAEDFYLKGRFYWNKRTPESLNQAVDAFTQAIARDPNYAEAYVGLADCYNLLREFSVMPANEAYLKAFSAAKKAVELDPQSADAHASLAFVTFWGMWDARGAEIEYRRAVELDPNNAKAHHWFATFLHALSRREEALAEIEAARKLDPHSPSILADKGTLLWVAGRREEALQLLTQMEVADPAFLSPHRYLRMAYFQTRDYPHYLEELRKEAQLTHDAVELSEVDAAAKGFAKGGERGLLEAQLADQLKFYHQGKLSPYIVAQSEARMGNTQEALNHLTPCVESHDGLILNVNIDPLFASLHGDPAYQKLLAIIGLPPSQ